MKISRSTSYALIAVGHIAKHKDDGAILAATVAKAYSIPLEYLLKILQQIVRANVLQSKRGPGGGFFMTRETSDVTLLEIVEAVDGPIADTLQLADQGNNEAFSKNIEDVCRHATNQVKQTYGQASLADILAE